MSCEADLNELIAVSIAQLRASRTGLQSPVRKSEGNVSSLDKDTHSMELLLKAAEDVKQKWSQRQTSGSGSTSTLTPSSRKQLVLRMIERSRQKSITRDSFPPSSVSFTLETEPSACIPTEDSPNTSPGRVVRTEESPVEGRKQADSPVKKLKQELKEQQEKYRKMEAMCAELVVRKERTQRKGDYKRMYEDLRTKYANSEKHWQSQCQSLRHDLEQKSQECAQLREQLRQFRATERPTMADLGMIAHLQKEVEDMKLRVAKTECDNAALRSQLTSR